MSSRSWLLLAAVATCCWQSSAFLRCDGGCSVSNDLECSVAYRGENCLSTALYDSSALPGKHDMLVIQQYAVNSVNRNYVGMNISWRATNDSSASYISGFEVSLMLIGSEVFNIQKCYIFNLTGKSNHSVTQLLGTVFTLHCWVSAKAEGVFTELYSLSKPKTNLLQKKVKKYIKITEMITSQKDPCRRDPQLYVTHIKQQLVVKVGKWIPGRRYRILLTQGSYESASRTIEPDNSSGQDSALFEGDELKQGRCYNIWAQLESCKNYWKSDSVCITTTTTTTTTTPMTPHIPGTDMPEVTAAYSHVSPTTSAILVVVVLLILCLAACALYHNLPSICQQGGSIKDETQTDPPPPEGICQQGGSIKDETQTDPPPPEDVEGVQELVLIYCLSPANKMCVKSFKLFLEELFKKSIKITDFVDDVGMDSGLPAWITTLKNSVSAPGGRLLVIYSSGLTHLFEADVKGNCYPHYEENERKGEHLMNLFKSLKDDIMWYNINKCKECVVSLGSEYTEQSRFLYKSLASFSGWKPKLFYLDQTGEVAVNQEDMISFLKWLGLKEPGSAPARGRTDNLKAAVKNMLDQEKNLGWFESKYGYPVPIIKVGNEEDRHSLTSDSGSDADSSSSFIVPNPDNNGQSDYCKNADHIHNIWRYPENSRCYPPDNQDYAPNKRCSSHDCKSEDHVGDMYTCFVPPKYISDSESCC